MNQTSSNRISSEELATGTYAGSGVQAFAPSEYETLSGLLRVLRRRWVTGAIIAFVVIALGVTSMFFMTPKYSATATLEINNGQGSDTGATQLNIGSQSQDELKADIDTYINILQSDDLALAVINDLDLEKKRPFLGSRNPREGDKPLESAPRTRQQMVSTFERFLKVESPTGTRLINVTFQSPDAELASAVANDVAQRFIDGTLERRHLSTAQSSYWLQKELDELKKKVEESEQKVADYERKRDLAGIQLSGSSGGDSGGGVSVTPHNTVSERLFTLNQELTSAEANRISSETVFHLVQSQDPEVVLGLGAMASSGGSSGALTSDGIQLVRSLRSQEASLTREYAGAAVKYGANNPRLIELQQQIDTTKQQMFAELQRISKRAENAYLYSKANEASIRDQFAKQQSAANLMADDTVQLQVLAQEAYSNRALYESLFSRLQTASLASGVRATRIDIVNKARAAGSPSSPDYRKYFAIIIGVGIFFGISAGFLRESFDETFRTSRDLDEMQNFPSLGYVPRMGAPRLLDSSSSNSQLIIFPGSPFSEAFRALRTSILLSTSAMRGNRLLVTSAVGGDGKTTVVFNLGVAFAQLGARVLLIDCDLRNPDLYRKFGAANSPGLGDLEGASPMEGSVGSSTNGVVQHATLPTLFLLPAGKVLSLPAEFLGSPLFDSVLKQYTPLFDYVLIDSPPLLPVTDASIIARKVNGIIAVVRSQSTTRTMASRFVEALKSTHVPVLGFLLNDVRDPTLDGFQTYSYSRDKEHPDYEHS